MLNENINYSVPNNIDCTNVSPNIYSDTDTETDTDISLNSNDEHNITVNREYINDDIEDNKYCLICMDETRTDNLILNKTYISSSHCNCEYYIHNSCFREWLAVKYSPKTTIIKCLICRSDVHIKENCCNYYYNNCIYYSNYCCKYLYYCLNPRCMFYVVTTSLVLLILVSSDGNVY